MSGFITYAFFSTFMLLKRFSTLPFDTNGQIPWGIFTKACLACRPPGLPSITSHAKPTGAGLFSAKTSDVRGGFFIGDSTSFTHFRTCRIRRYTFAKHYANFDLDEYVDHLDCMSKKKFEDGGNLIC